MAELYDQLVKDKRGEILRIASRHGARDVRVFGSVARGEADRESDVDFLVELEAGRSLLDLGGLQMELESLLGCRVDVVTVRGLKHAYASVCCGRRCRSEKSQRVPAGHAGRHLRHRVRPGQGELRTGRVAAELVPSPPADHRRGAQGSPRRRARPRPGDPWSSIIGMRNFLVHGYFDIDIDIV